MNVWLFWFWCKFYETTLIIWYDSFFSSICKNHIVWYDFDLSFLFETIVQIIFIIIMDINNS
jgi:hypothetical protein